MNLKSNEDNALAKSYVTSVVMNLLDRSHRTSSDYNLLLMFINQHIISTKQIPETLIGLFLTSIAASL